MTFFSGKCTYYCYVTYLDHKIGFGGKFGVQKDRVDKSAVGWEHHEKIEKHESQRGNYSTSHLM